MNNSRRGFTLIELIVVIGIFALIMGIIYGIFISSRRVQTAEEQLVGLSQEARGGLEMFIREARMAGAKSAAAVNACSTLITYIGNDIEFEGDVDLDGRLERVRYFYNSTTNTLNRWSFDITTDSPRPINCNTTLASASGLNIQKDAIAYGIGNFTINYYNSGNQLLTQPISNAADISKIEVTITARGALPPNPQKTLTVEVKLPNLGIKKAGFDTTPPATPTGVCAVNRRVCGYLGVTWNANTEKDLAGYKVYYKMRNLDGTWPDEWSGWAMVGLVIKHEFAGLSNGATYRVGVAAFDTSGNMSAISNTLSACATVTLNDDIDPTAGTVSAISNDTDFSIVVSWTQGSDKDLDNAIKNAAGDYYSIRYTLLRDTSAAGAFNYKVVELLEPITNTTWRDTSVDKCQIYYYKVQAIDACGRSALSAAYGADRTTKGQSAGTKIIEDNVLKPTNFYAGGGTVHTTQGKKTYAYARFSGLTNGADPYGNKIEIRYNTGTSCPSAPTLTGSPPSPGGTALGSSTFDPPLYPIEPGTSFTGRWPDAPKAEGIYKGNFYRFAAFSQNKCGYWSEPFDPGYCVDKCTDSTTYPGSTGLGDACVMDYLGNPIQARVCDRITIWWRTKDDSGNPPPACIAFGSGAQYDFYPDQGDGGYLIHRAVETDDVRNNGELFHVLAPDPVTGPIQPFYYSDYFYDGTMSQCERVAATNETFYRDRCSYRYKIKAVDCALNQSAQEAIQSGNRISPGLINAPDPDKYPVAVSGTKKNIVRITLQNTAVAKVTLKKLFLSWIDTAAKLTKIEIYNSVESGTTWSTMWEASANNTGISNDTTIDFSSSSYTDWSGTSRTAKNINIRSLGASPVLDPLNLDNTYKAWIRLTFMTTSGTGQRMDDFNEEITLTPYWENETSTHTDKLCPPIDEPAAFERVRFTVRPIQPPTISDVYQNPPNTSGLIQGDAAISNTPPSDIFRNDNYIINGPSGVNAPVSPTIRVLISPYSSSYPVSQCGDTSANTGVILFYKDTDFNTDTPPEPGDDLLNPTDYTKVSMCREDGTSDCSSGTCQYSTYTLSNPSAGSIPSFSGRRVWFYIAAIDSKGNYNITPMQATDIFDTSYNYDTCGALLNYVYIWTYPSFSAGYVTVSNLWTTRISGCSSSSPTDYYTAGSNLKIEVSGWDLNDGITPITETIDKTTLGYGYGCSGCWPCESGLGSSITTTKQFAQPTPVKPLSVKFTEERCGFNQGVCTFTTTDGAIWTKSGICH